MSIELSSSGARAVLEPSAGGRLHQLFVDLDGVETPLLWSPGEIAEYAAAPLYGGSYPMAPWPNRIRDGVFHWNGREYRLARGDEHSLHGLVFTRPWEVVARVGRVVEMTCAFGPGWPWEGRAWQRFELGPNFLAMKLEVRAAREPFPAGAGWHPWFLRTLGPGGDPEAVRVTVPAARRYVLEGQLPTGERVPPEGEYALDGSALAGRRIDACYTGLTAPTTVIEWPNLRVEMTVDCAFPHVQVYTPAEAFCVEPQTCVPDAFNFADVSGGAGVAAPGRAVSLASRWTWART